MTQKHYTDISMRMLSDSRLSWRAKGVMAAILSQKPSFTIPVDESEIDFDHLQAAAKEKRSTLQTAICNLKKLHYVVVTQKRRPFVYLVKSEWSGNYKIGFTAQKSVEDRLEMMRTGDPSLKLIFKIHAGVEFERKLHSLYAAKHIAREWFGLSPSDVCEIVSTMTP